MHTAKKYSMAHQPKCSEYLGLAEAVDEFQNQPEISQLTGSASILHTNYTVINLALRRNGTYGITRTVPSYAKLLALP